MRKCWILNITEIGNVFALIFKGAFAPAAGLGGIIGVLIQGLFLLIFDTYYGIKFKNLDD